jgi:hypothetical protein
VNDAQARQQPAAIRFSILEQKGYVLQRAQIALAFAPLYR